ncbi:hypothetical protein BKA83DRAFT_4301820 [Pisolithus microcarpus]|nr:hypothetical protein BKA83DRAFT_4301820 [Pisolithus microcarpus]
MHRLRGVIVLYVIQNVQAATMDMAPRGLLQRAKLSSKDSESTSPPRTIGRKSWKSRDARADFASPSRHRSLEVGSNDHFLRCSKRTHGLIDL